MSIPEFSKTIASAGRVLLVFASAHLLGSMAWVGPRPGDVVSGFPGPHQNVNVKLDGANDQAILASFRERPEGNTLSSVPVFDPLTDEQRVAVAAVHRHWCEWMPFQAGQAAKTNALETEIKAAVDVARERLDGIIGRIDRLEHELAARGSPSTGSDVGVHFARIRAALTCIASHLSNDGSGIERRVSDILDGVPAANEGAAPGSAV